MSKIIKNHYLTVDKENTFNVDIPVFDNVINDAVGLNYVSSGGEISSEDILEIAKAQAGSVIGDAKKEADYIVLEAHKTAVIEAEKIKGEASKEGYKLGFKKGSEEGERLKKEAEKVLASAKEEKEKILADIEPALINMTINIIDKIINNAKIINPDVIKCIIKMGMAQTKIMGDIFIRVSEADFENVLNSKDEIIPSSDSSANVEILKDSTLNAGDCLIETPFGNIDCGVDQQLREIKNDLYYILQNR